MVDQSIERCPGRSPSPAVYEPLRLRPAAISRSLGAAPRTNERPARSPRYRLYVLLPPPPPAGPGAPLPATVAAARKVHCLVRRCGALKASSSLQSRPAEPRHEPLTGAPHVQASALALHVGPSPRRRRRAVACPRRRGGRRSAAAAAADDDDDDAPLVIECRRPTGRLMLPCHWRGLAGAAVAGQT